MESYEDYLKSKIYILTTPSEKWELPKEELEEVYVTAIELFNSSDDPKKAFVYLAEKHVIEGIRISSTVYIHD
jgi:hypothetical protein